MMEKTKKILCWAWVSFLAWVALSVTIDTYVLGGKLKLLWIALANTTSSSPYSTDGQSNIFIIIAAVVGISVAMYVWRSCLFPEKKDVDDKDKDKDKEHEG